MKRIALALIVLSAIALSEDPAPFEHSKLLWQDMVGLAELVLLPDDPGAVRIPGHLAGGIASSVLATVVRGGVGAERLRRGASSALVGLGTASVAGVIRGSFVGENRRQEEKKLLDHSELVKQIRDKIGEARTNELIAELRSRTGLFRLLREYGDLQQAAGFIGHFRTEREKLAQLVPEHALGKEDRNSLLDLAAARRAAIVMAMEHSDEKQKAEMVKKLEADLKIIADAMKDLPPAPVPHPAGAQPSTH